MENKKLKKSLSKKLIIFLALVICFIAYFFITSHLLENKFIKLQRERGYSRSDYTILEIDHSFINKYILNLGYLWWINVEYIDEPMQEYQYVWVDGAWIDSGSNGLLSEPKHYLLPQ